MFCRCHRDRSAWPTRVRARREHWCSIGRGWMGRERKFLHSTLGEWGHPRDVPSAGSCSREKREPEDKAAVKVDRAEEEEEGVGVSASMGFMSLHCPASPSHKVLPRGVARTHSLLPAPVTASPTTQGHFSQARPGTWDARCNAGSSQHHPTVPSAHPGTGWTLQSRNSQPTQHHLQHPQQHRSHRPLSHTGPGPQGQHWVPYWRTRCQLPPPPLPPKAAAGAVGFI